MPLRHPWLMTRVRPPQRQVQYHQPDAASCVYRPNCGMILLNAQGLAFWGQRLGGGWQFPQGGIQEGETPQMAMLRELREETGLLPEHVEILGRTQDWLFYDLPPHFRRRPLPDGRVFMGQKQIWFLLRLCVEETCIDLAASGQPEFCAWRWCALKQTLAEAVDFKRNVYTRALAELCSV